jgi:DNA-binding PucR family transcriptional regulator
MTFTAVAFELLGDDADQAATTVLAERAVNLIALHCEAYRRQAVAVAVGPVVHVLLPEGSAPDRTQLRRFLSDLVARTAESLRVSLRVAIGATVDGIGELARSHREATRVLRAVRALDLPASAVVAIDDVRSHVVLFELQDLATREPELREGKVALLVALDAEKQTTYVETLRAYLDHFGDVPTAAEAIDVHPNTFRYRLRRLVELANLNLDDPTERLVAHLQLTLLR